ncbi:pregnancy zone protein-like [Drosophila busckii]|uniref:pregnancy zone protein-like n=1 Tax=Drosophila busckii TaxID=30019 RepID=UPI0014332A0E|nr:pregnancy zone protein-like [Drosophila busckii]
MLGTWRICAQNGNRMREQCSYVKIEDYELPIFDVTVQAPTELFLADKELKLNVSASYYIGMPVMGEATLNIETFSEQADASESLMMKKSLELSKGLVAFSFALNDFKTLIPNNQPLLLLVTAEVEEKLTKLRVNSTASITLWEKVFPDNGDSKKKRMARCKSATKCKKNELNDDELSSEISADIKPKPRTKTANHMTLNFGEVLKEPTFVTFEFDVKMKYAVCVIMFNGRILAGKKLVPENDGHNFKISIDVTTKTWPFVHVFVFGMETGSSELILSAKTINVKRKHHTHTEIKAPAVVRPGEDVTLEVRSPAKSYMGLMGINSRVMQIGDGAVNDFSKEFIDKMKELIRGHLPGKLAKGNLTAHKLGIVTLTNALTVVDGENSPPAKITPRHMPQSYVRRPLKWNPLLSRMPSKFNDVWIFKSIPDTKAGWHKIIARVPDAIANWRFTAFTVDPDVGLTILHDQPFVDILSTKPLFMNAKLPKTLKLGEILAIPLTCFNHYTQDLNVTVRLRNDASKFELLDSERKPLPESEYTTQHFILLQNATNLVTMYLRGLQLGVIHLNFTATAGVHQDAMSDSLRIVETGHILNQQELVFQTLGTKNKDTSWEAQIQLKHQHSGNGVECLIANNMVIAKIFTERPYSELDNTENLISKLISYYNIWSFMRERSIEYKQWLPHMEEQLNNGYQLLLHLRNSDGGFAYYAQPGAGAGASCSSTWLTAFALQAFQLLQKTLVLVDEKFILDCEKFLLNRLRNSSHYVELCETPGRRPLEVLELTMEVQKILQLSSRLLNLQMTQRWINDQMRSVHDNHLKVKRGLESIEWSPPKSDELNNWEEQRRQIETAGRLLNIQMRRKSLLQLQANSIYKWLIKYLFGEVNDANCYECAIAEQAIFAYLRTKISLLTKLNVELWTDSMPKRTKLSFTNANRFQPVHLPFQTKNQTIKLMAKGRGDLLVRCTFDYEVNDQMEHSDDTSHKHEPQLYSVTVNQTGSEDLKNTHQVTLEVCVERKDVDRKNYIGTELEIQLPTGYELKHGAVKTLLGNPKVRQAAAGVDNTNLFVELLTLAPEDSICLAVSAVRVHTVENLQSGKASAFDINILREPDTFGYTIKV